MDLTQYMEDKNKMRVCRTCNESVNVSNVYKDQVDIFINLPIKISQLVYLRTVSKKWCKIIKVINIDIK